MLSCSTLLLITTIIIIIMSAWSLNTFIRLKNVLDESISNEAFEDANHMSVLYVKGGKIIAFGILVIFTIVFAILLYYNNSL
jgi:hypothetical protein